MYNIALRILASRFASHPRIALRILESRLRILYIASRIALHIISDETVNLLGHHSSRVLRPQLASCIGFCNTPSLIVIDRRRSLSRAEEIMITSCLLRGTSVEFD